jgi:hypothetical protein
MIITMTQEEIPAKTDSFGDKMVYVDSYGDYLPKSENIPQTQQQFGVTGITHDGAIYCLDCAQDMGLITIEDNEVLVQCDNGKKKPRNSPWTGIVLPSYETSTILHCSCHKNCINAVDGKNHPYNHDEPIGIGIQERTYKH